MSSTHPPGPASPGPEPRPAVVAAGAEIEGPLPDAVVQAIIGRQFLYSMFGLAVALVCVVAGVVLFCLGVTGSVSWTAELAGGKSKLADAAPGVVLFVVAALVVYLTRYGVQVRQAAAKKK